jgi:hypothetical protein
VFRGYYRTSRRSGVSYPLGLWILFLPALVVFGIFWAIFHFIGTDRISPGRKGLILVLFVAGVAIIVASHGSHCDATGACHQSRLEGDLSAYGAVMLLIGAVLAFLGLDAKK